LGLLVKAKNMGIISAVKPAFGRIIKAGLFIERGFLKNLLKKLGE
jgi:predicted nucleic acid-binding protein